MKIAIIIPLFLPKNVGGKEIATFNIAKYLTERGHEVYIITTLDKGLPKESVENGVYIRRICQRKIKLSTGLFWIKTFWEIKKINPHIINVQGIMVAIPAYLAKKFLGMSYVIYGRGSDVYLPATYIKLISKIVLKNAGSVIALTESMKKKLQEIYARDMFVVPNGIDLKKFDTDLEKKMCVKKTKKVILFIGRLHAVKGVRYLIEAMKIIQNEDSEIKLMLVGDGKDRTKLQKLVKSLDLGDCVSFAGQIPNHRIPEYMATSDIFVLPSLSEGFPNVILEAMASRLPIIATDSGGIPCLIQNEVNGFLVKPRNSNEIAKKILFLLKNDKVRQDISANNKNLAKEYSWEKIVVQLEKIFLKCV